MDVADAAMEKQRILSALVRKMNATTSAVGKEKGTIPTPFQVFQAILNSLPRLPAIPTISRPPTPLTEVFEVKHPSAEEEVTAPVEVAEEFPSPQTDISRLYLLS